MSVDGNIDGRQIITISRLRRACGVEQTAIDRVGTRLPLVNDPESVHIDEIAIHTLGELDAFVCWIKE